jgi:fluoroquinolone transport system ATP-binding protein
MISVNSLRFSYTKQPFIEDMSFEVKEGEILGFLGPSGAGKSTLQKILTGLLTNYEGSVRVNGIEVKKLILSSPAFTRSLRPGKTLDFLLHFIIKA